MNGVNVKGKRKMQEKDEKPVDEVRAHSPEFLAKAAKMSKRKGGKRYVSAHHHGARKTAKRRERKRSYSKR